MQEPLWTKSAGRDLDDALDYFFQYSEERAAEFLRDVREKTGLYAKQPRIGCRFPALPISVRAIHLRPFVLLYREFEDTILVLRVIHGARDIPTQFAEDSGEGSAAASD